MALAGESLGNLYYTFEVDATRLLATMEAVQAKIAGSVAAVEASLTKVSGSMGAMTVAAQASAAKQAAGAAAVGASAEKASATVVGANTSVQASTVRVAEATTAASATSIRAYLAQEAAIKARAAMLTRLAIIEAAAAKAAEEQALAVAAAAKVEAQAAAVAAKAHAARAAAFKGLVTSTISSVDKLAKQVSLTLAVIGGVAIKVFADFDKAMIQSTAIMGNLSVAIEREMRTVARVLAREGIQSAKQLADSYYFLASAGFDAQQSIAALPAVQKFATAGAFDMARATDLLTDAQSALGLTVKDAAKNLENMVHLSDVLTKANTLANASTEQFSNALVNKAASAAKILGKDMEETVAVLAAFADQGVKDVEAGEKLNIVWRDLQRSALENESIFKKFQIAVYDSNGEMNNTADIIGDITRTLAGMSDEQKRATLQLLGFQDRSVSATLQLVGMADKIRDYQRKLYQAGGITEEVANKQMQALANQLTRLKNNLADIAITVGETLAPVLVGFVEDLQQFSRATDNAASGAQRMGEVVRTSLVTIVAGTAEVIHGWELIIAGLRDLTAGQIEWILKAVSAAVTAQEKLIQAMVDGVNKVIELQNKVHPIKINPIEFTGFETAKDLRNLAEGATISAAEFHREFLAEMNKPDPWETIWNRVNANLEQARQKTETARKESAAATANQWLDDLNQTIANGVEDSLRDVVPATPLGIDPIALKIQMDMVAVDPFAEALQGLDVYNRAFDKLLIGPERYMQEVERMMGGVSEFFSRAPIATGVDELDQLNAFRNQERQLQESYARQRGVIEQALEGLNGIHNEQADKERARFELQLATMDERYKALTEQQKRDLAILQTNIQPPPVETGIAGVDEARQMDFAEEQLRRHHENQLKALESFKTDSLVSERKRLQLIQEENERYLARLENIERARTQMVLSTSGAMFGDLATIAKGFAGEQSGIYKALFAASKAFAIAESIVKIQQGIASAASLPFPANLAAMASVVAATANIVTTIQGVKFNPEARAYGGPVEGGQLYRVNEMQQEYFRPSGRGEVIPLSRMDNISDPNSAGEESGNTYNFHYNFQSGVTREEVASLLPTMVRMSVSAVQEEARRGRRFR